MPSESVNFINQTIRQPKRRYRLTSDEHGRGRVESYVPGETDDQDTGTTSERPGVEKPILRPIAAIPKRD